MESEDPRIATNNYYDTFDSKRYCQDYYSEITGCHKQALKLLHELYATSPAGLDHVLEYGCGPVVVYQISAALQATNSIVMADFLKQNRTEVQLWVDKDPEAVDWSPFFKYVVVELEGKSEQESIARESELRKRIKAVVPCDITKDPPIQPGYEGPYDVICSSFVLESSFSSLKGYEEGVARLAKLLKPGGRLCLNSIEGEKESAHFYMVGSEKFFTLNVTQEVHTAIFTKLGFRDIKVVRYVSQPGVDFPEGTNDFTAFVFSMATKY